MTQAANEMVDFTDPHIPVKAYTTNYQGVVVPHLHNEVEWLYVLSGSFKVWVMEEEITLKQGEIIIINSHVVHSTANDSPDNYICLLQFNPDVLVHHALISEYRYAMPFLCQDRFHYRIVRPMDAGQQREFAMLLTDTANEFLYKTDGYEMMIKSNLYKLLALMYRHHLIRHEQPKTPVREGSVKTKLSKVTDYVEKHYDEALDVPQMAAMLDLNPDYFCRLFKSVTGQTFVQYLNHVRISVAERMLHSTDRLITDILVETGFSSLSYFNRTFKKIKHCSPSEYRRKIAAGLRSYGTQDPIVSRHLDQLSMEAEEEVSEYVLERVSSVR